jgi:hypothetical protein
MSKNHDAEIRRLADEIARLKAEVLHQEDMNRAVLEVAKDRLSKIEALELSLRLVALDRRTIQAEALEEMASALESIITTPPWVIIKLRSRADNIRRGDMFWWDDQKECWRCCNPRKDPAVEAALNSNDGSK